MNTNLPKTLNLLQPNATPKSSWDKIYEWVFKVGRYIIIGVEIVVVAAFAARFGLDQKNNDLKENLDAKVSLIQRQEEFEDKIRDIQKNLRNISILINDQETMASTIESALGKIPNSVKIDNLSFNTNRITMNCRATSYETIDKIETSFDNDNDFEDPDISLSKAGDEVEEISFTLTITLPQENE